MPILKVKTVLAVLVMAVTVGFGGALINLRTAAGQEEALCCWWKGTPSPDVLDQEIENLVEAALKK